MAGPRELRVPEINIKDPCGAVLKVWYEEDWNTYWESDDGSNQERYMQGSYKFIVKPGFLMEAQFTMWLHYDWWAGGPADTRHLVDESGYVCDHCGEPTNFYLGFNQWSHYNTVFNEHSWRIAEDDLIDVNVTPMFKSGPYILRSNGGHWSGVIFVDENGNLITSGHIG